MTGCVHLTLRGDDDAFDVLVKEAQRKPRDANYGAVLFEYAWSRHRSLFVHEWAHVLQSATYPLLFLRRCARAGRVMAGFGRFLKENPGHHVLPLGFRMEERWGASQVLDMYAFTAEVRTDSVKWSQAEVGAVRRGTLTEREVVG